MDAIDPRTGRPIGDHGTALQAINFALDKTGLAPEQTEIFLWGWREGNLDDWPDFYEWLKTQENTSNA